MIIHSVYMFMFKSERDSSFIPAFYITLKRISRIDCIKYWKILPPMEYTKKFACLSYWCRKAKTNGREAKRRYDEESMSLHETISLLIPCNIIHEPENFPLSNPFVFMSSSTSMIIIRFNQTMLMIIWLGDKTIITTTFN